MKYEVLEGLTSCSPGTFVATSAKLISHRCQDDSKPSTCREKAARSQPAHPVTYNLQILKLAQLRLKEPLPEQHLLALTQTAAAALDGLQQSHEQLQSKPCDLAIQRYSIVRLLVARGQFKTGLTQGWRLHSEVAASLTDADTVLPGSFHAAIVSRAAASASQETGALVLGTLLSLLKCTIEVSKPATLLDGLEPLRADLAQLESWLRCGWHRELDT